MEGFGFTDIFFQVLCGSEIVQLPDTWTFEAAIKFVCSLKESQFQHRSDSSNILECKVLHSAFDSSPQTSAVFGGHSPTGLAAHSSGFFIGNLSQDFMSSLEDGLGSSVPVTIELPPFSTEVSKLCFFKMTAPKAAQGDASSACYSEAEQGSQLFMTSKGACWPPHICCNQATHQLSLLVLCGQVVIYTWDFDVELLTSLTCPDNGILDLESRVFMLNQGERLHMRSPAIYAMFSTEKSVFLMTPWVDASDCRHVTTALDAFDATSLPVPHALKAEFVSKRQKYLSSTCPAMFIPSPTSNVVLLLKRGEVLVQIQFVAGLMY